MLFGVCGGIGESFGIDPVWIRLAFAVSLAAFGVGLFAYLILAIVMR